MKQRRRAKRLKWAASKHPAMYWPAGSWFVDVPPVVAVDLRASALPDPAQRGTIYDYAGEVGAIDCGFRVTAPSPAVHP